MTNLVLASRRGRWLARPALRLIYRTGFDETPGRLRAEAAVWWLIGNADLARRLWRKAQCLEAVDG